MIIFSLSKLCPYMVSNLLASGAVYPYQLTLASIKINSEK